MLLVFATWMCLKCYTIFATSRKFLRTHRNLLQNNVAILKTVHGENCCIRFFRSGKIIMEYAT
jgi:hypothetical protein